MYTMHSNRSDIAFFVCKLSISSKKTGNNHWKAIARILGHLKRITNFNLIFSDYSCVLESYSDASWIINASDSKSILAWIFTFGGVLLIGLLRSKTCITHSTNGI